MRFRPARVFFGWWVAWTGFLMALFAWGFGFYGPGVFLVWLTLEHGWAVWDVSLAVTAYYALGAAFVFVSGDIYLRLGHRRACLLGAASLALAALAMTQIDQIWQMWLAFGVMALGWALLGTVGVNVVIAPWFEARRGFVVSLALNGASMGGVLIAPLLVLLAGSYGTLTAVLLVAMLMAMTLGVFAVLTLHRTPADLGLHPDGAAHGTGDAGSGASVLTRRSLLGSWRLWSIALPFSLALLVQVGVLTHQIRYLTDWLAPGSLALLVSLSGVMAVLGRVGTGMVIDRVNRRHAAALNFTVQGAALVLLAMPGSPALVWTGWLMFGLGVGNQVTLSGLIAQHEFARADFARVVALVVAISQFTYAFGPAVIGALSELTGGYAGPFLAAAVMLVVAGVLVARGRPGDRGQKEGIGPLIDV